MFKLFKIKIAKTVFAFKIAKITGPNMKGFALFTKFFTVFVAA